MAKRTPSLKPRNWVLLVIGAGSRKPLSPVQLQKALFLLERNLSVAELRTSDFYEFKPYDYGPFDRRVYSDAEELEDEGLIIIAEGSKYRRYRLTPEGSVEAKGLLKELGTEVRDYLNRLIDWVREQSFQSLVSAIYREYPEMKVNSVFQA